MGRDQVRALQQGGKLSLAAILARVSGRFRGQSGSPSK